MRLHLSFFCLAFALQPVLVAAQESKAELEAQSEKPSIEISGFVRARYVSIFESSDGPDFVGENDGFFLENARLVADVKKRSMFARISIDGSVDRRDANNTAVGQVDVGMRDAWVGYETKAGFGILVGQFKPPFDAEELQSTADMVFIDRSVESRGVRGVEGFNTSGLSLPRQAGVQTYGRVHFDDQWRLDYALSVTNGSRANQPVNDNETLAYIGRISLHQGPYMTIGCGAYQNRVTNGVPPDLLSEDLFGWVVDLKYQRPVGPVRLLLSGQYMSQSTDALDVPDEPTMTARGYHGAAGVELPMGVILAYRYAYVDPTAEFESEDPAATAVLDNDAVTLHTAALSYGFKDIPVQLQMNYTLFAEQDGRTIDNDRLDLLVQAIF
ncbi:MAG: porin [Myxococcota bacterium]|nr:porin [Myxococcota bacterium]